MNKPLGPLPTRGLAREELSPARRAVLDALIDLGGRRTVAELAAELGQHPNTVREHLEALARVELAERTLRHTAGRGRPAALYRATLSATPAGPEYAVLAEVLINYLARTVPDEAMRVEHALTAGRDWGRAIRERRLVDASREERLAAAGLRPVDDSAPASAEDGPGHEDAPGPRPTSGEPAAERTGGPAEDPRKLRDSVSRLGEMLDRAGFDCHTTEDADGGYTQRLRRCPVLALAREHPEVVCTSHLGMAQDILGHEGVSADRVSLEAFAEPGACLLRIAPPAAGHE
ncbi:helix-turn-helix transcriptional regulator [Georgenia sp. H159]|uniref:helix-turn-helix transcriptional regulator n=1 Tax=Georgenia sp. H159 TaxID=3076115 RepID=UPI002D787179|nr:helix-turn-helix domain-containing protein [Georgenia sp. H159]